MTSQPRVRRGDRAILVRALRDAIDWRVSMEGDNPLPNLVERYRDVLRVWGEDPRTASERLGDSLTETVSIFELMSAPDREFQEEK